MPDTPTAAPPVPTAPTSTVNPHTKSGLSESEASTMVQWMKADLIAGKISQPQADAIFNELNKPAEQRAAVTRSEEEKQLDRACPVARPSDYTVRFAGPGEEVAMTPQLREADTLVRNWLYEMGFSRENGSTIADIVLKLGQKKMTPAQVAAHVEAENVKLDKLYRNTYDERMEPAARMIHEVDAKLPGLKKFLRANGVGDTAEIVNMLANQARIYWAKRNAQQGR